MAAKGELSKTLAVSARVMPAEKQVLEAMARQDLRLPSELVRELIRAEAQRRGFWPSCGQVAT